MSPPNQKGYRMFKIKHLLWFPIFLVCYELSTYLSSDMYLPAVPNFVSDLKVSQTVGQFSITAWFIGASSMQLLVGPLSDQFGRRPILLTGGVVFIFSCLNRFSRIKQNSCRKFRSTHGCKNGGIFFINEHIWCAG